MCTIEPADLLFNLFQIHFNSDYPSYKEILRNVTLPKLIDRTLYK